MRYIVKYDVRRQTLDVNQIHIIFCTQNFAYTIFTYTHTYTTKNVHYNLLSTKMKIILFVIVALASSYRRKMKISLKNDIFRVYAIFFIYCEVMYVYTLRLCVYRTSTLSKNCG